MGGRVASSRTLMAPRRYAIIGGHRPTADCDRLADETTQPRLAGRGCGNTKNTQTKQANVTCNRSHAAA